MKRPNKKNYTIPQYSFGGWLKKNAGLIGTGVGALGAIALTGGLAAPAVAPAVAGAAGTTAAATGGATAALAAGALGSTLGGQAGGAVQQGAMQQEAIESQRQTKVNQQNASIAAQSKYNPNNPIFRCGGKYPGGGLIPKSTLVNKLGMDTTQYDTMRSTRSYLSNYEDFNNPDLYKNMPYPENPGSITSVIAESGDKGLPYRKEFINNWNQYQGAGLGYYYDPDKTRGLGFPIDKSSPQFEQMDRQYNPSKYNQLTHTPRYTKDSGAMTSYAQGGYTVNNRGFANSELEDEEVYRTPQGGMFQLDGPTHAQGGIAMNLPQGTEILGKNKIPGTNKSFKEYGSKLMREYNKYTKILSEKSTPLAKKSAQMMLDKTQQDFTNTMNLQESLKSGQDEQMEEYAKGGWIQKAINPKHKGFCTPMTKSTCTPHRKALAKRFKSGDLHKHDEGGQIREFQRYYGLKPTGQWDTQTLDYWDKYGKIYSENMNFRPTSISMLDNKIDPDISNQINSIKTTNISPTIDSNNMNFSNTLNTVGTIAPIAFNIAQGLFGKPQRLNASDFYNPQQAEATRLMSNRRVNVNPELEANRVAQLNYTRALRQGAPSQSQYLGNIQNSQIARSRADAEVYSKAQNMNNAYMGEEAQMRANLGSQQAQTKLGIQDINDKNLAARRAYLPTALTQMQQYAQNARMTKNLQNRDKQLMDIYKQVYRGYNFIPQFN